MAYQGFNSHRGLRLKPICISMPRDSSRSSSAKHSGSLTSASSRRYFCDRALVGGWTRGDEPIRPYTIAETMDAGWCWQIEHEFRINRGYVYSSDFISDSDAEAELRQKKPKIGPTRVIRFTTGRYQRSWVKNVVGMGNAAGFVEPLEATAFAAICINCLTLTEALTDSACSPSNAEQLRFNHKNSLLWDGIRHFLSLHYRYDSRLDTLFWRECRKKVDMGPAAEVVEYYREAGPSLLWRHHVVPATDPFGLEGYFSLLVGLQVPYKRQANLPEKERQNWEQMKKLMADTTRRWLSVTEALWVIRSDWFEWPADLDPDLAPPSGVSILGTALSA